MRVRRLVAVLLVAALPACTVGVRRRAEPSHPPRPPSSPVALPSCRTAYAAPDPHRPRIKLTLTAGTADEDPAQYSGDEHVVFTPDAPITEVVFRLWPNGPASRAHGGSLRIYSASLPMRSEPLGGTADLPTLVALRLPKPSPAGVPVTVDLSFVLTLPEASLDRWGYAGQTLYWWGSGHPVLAWVRGSGWRTEPAVGLLGETAVSEAADYDVTLETHAGFTAVGFAEPEPLPGGGLRLTRYHLRNPVARDVAFAVSRRFATRRSEVDGVPLLVAASEGVVEEHGEEATLDELTALATDALRAHVRRFGPYPYPMLSVVAMKPIADAGVEYPGIVFVGDRDWRTVVPHELAHQWFYGLVGDDQARDPWLDEAFATYAQALVNGDEDRFLDAVDRDGAVGAPMAYWDRHRNAYGPVVYGKGAGALLAAREAAGAEIFDRLLRCYVAAQAYRVASPVDVINAFSSVPEAVAILRDAGAVSR